MSKFIAAALVICAFLPQALPLTIVKVVEIKDKIEATTQSIQAALVVQE